VLTKSLFRTFATYSLFTEGIYARSQRIETLFDALGIDPYGTDEQISKTVKRVVHCIYQQENSDLTSFWQDVAKVFGSDARPLNGRKVLLGTDGELHANDKTCSVFFRPRMGGADDEVESEVAVEDASERLCDRVAFLNEVIRIHEPDTKVGVRTIAVHAFLSTRLVESFGVEQILRSVLVEATPSLPITFGTPGSDLYKDILVCDVRLLRSARQASDDTFKLVWRLPAHCLGGWFQLHETMFGPGWPGTAGEYVNEYLSNSRIQKMRKRRTHVF